MEKPEENNNAADSSVESTNLLASCVVHIHEDHALIQEHDYIEDGWFIKVTPSQVQLWEIPQYGGEPSLVNTYPSIQDAFRRAKSLC